ncbi:hypothetical protein M8J76_004950 [Diaphorina citri]|nr:hypothetical protein M8J75_014583 [Diaphorina citri]KAI5740548.1 hypothetical protein M8J76_004950 [Diaphorina citri]
MNLQLPSILLPDELPDDLLFSCSILYKLYAHNKNVRLHIVVIKTRLDPVMYSRQGDDARSMLIADMDVVIVADSC